MVKKKSIETLISKELVDYNYATNFMEQRIEAIKNNTKPEMIWLLSHPSIYTCGISSNKKDFLSKPNIPVYEASRGGQITYHGPGQRIVYVMLNLNENKDLRKFIKTLENICIECLKEFGIESRSYRNRIGIWVKKNRFNNPENEKKIGSIGIKIKKWVTFHGFSLNVNPNLEYFNSINSCGIKNCKVTSIKDLGINITNKEFDKVLLKNLNKFLY
tara:strand:+ start:238 stop:885 length:648 start_codon:yes stop_codon:yes gene_type:complete